MTLFRDRRPFNPDTGLPAAGEQVAAGAVSWYEHARAYTEAKWPHLAPTSRRSAAEALDHRHRGAGLQPQPSAVTPHS